MPTVQSQTRIDTNIEKVYAIARDVEKFPQFMPDVESVRILEDDGSGRVVSEWIGKIRQFNRTLKWIEEDVWDDKTKTCTFRQLKGDFTEYGGEWTFSPSEDGKGTESVLRVHYTFDVPLIGGIIKGVLQKLVQQNGDNMLQSLKQYAEDK